MLAAKGDDTGGKMICFLQILFFVCLNHQFVHHYYIAVRQRFRRLQAKFHDSTASLIDFNESSGTWNAVDTMIYRRARYLQVSELDKLLVLILRQHFPEQYLGTALSREMLTHRLAETSDATIGGLREIVDRQE